MEDYYGKLPGAMLLLLEKRRLELFLEDPRIDAYKERLNRAEITFSEPYSQTINGYQLFKHVSELSRRIEIKYTNNRITLYFPQDDRDWLNQAIRLLSQIRSRSKKMRLDKYLKVARVLKRREAAKQLAQSGRVMINGKVVKPSHEVQVGDQVTLTFGNREMTIEINAIRNQNKRSDEPMFTLIRQEIIDDTKI